MFLNKVPIKPPIKEISISLTWTDMYGPSSKGFSNIEEFASFLRDNPELGKAVGYVPKLTPSTPK